jgi:hypothetical protein
MGEVPADANLFLMAFPGGSRRAGILVTVGHVLVCVIDDRLDALPARQGRSEQAPCDVGEPIGVAITAAEQIGENIGRQRLRCVLLGVDDLAVRIAFERDALEQLLSPGLISEAGYPCCRAGLCR